MIGWTDVWLNDLRFYVLFKSVSVISGRWEVDNERLCAMELRLQLRRFRLERKPQLRRKVVTEKVGKTATEKGGKQQMKMEGNSK